MFCQLERERDLVVVSQETALDSELAIVALHFRRHANGRLINPSTHRRERLAFDSNEILRLGKTNRPAEEVLGLTPSLLGAFQFLLIRRHCLKGRSFSNVSLNYVESRIRILSIIRFHIV